MAYRYGLRRPNNLTSTITSGVQTDESATVEPQTADEPVAEHTDATEGVSYRDLQAQAKEVGVPANQSREDLEAALNGAT